MAETLVERIGGPARRQRVLDDCVRLIDDEMRAKSGLLSIPIKAGYKVVTGLKPGFTRHAMDGLLDDFCIALEPFYRQWQDAPKDKRPGLGEALKRDENKVADALLGVTDARAARAQHQLLKSTYGKLRGMAKGHVIAALPGLGRTIQPHVVDVSA